MNMKPDKIERLNDDTFYPSFLSSEYANKIIDVVNALINLEAKNGKVIWSDSNVVIDVTGSSSPTPQTPSTGSTFISSSIYCLARWS
jgi:hypothetical protein